MLFCDVSTERKRHKNHGEKSTKFMDKVELANRRAKDAIVELLVAMEQPKSDDERRCFTLGWENTNWSNLFKSLEYNLTNNPYRDSVLIQQLKEHAEWAIREAENVKTMARKQREAIHA